MRGSNEISVVMANRLKQLRESKGLSHEKLCKAILERYNIKISSDSLQNYEVADINHTKAYKNQGMRVEYLRCLADFYGVSADYLLGISDVQSPDPKVTEVMQYTGLTEENVNLLHADLDYLYNSLPDCYSSIFGLGERSFRTLANDMVGLLKNKLLLVRFKQLLRIYTKFKDIGAANDIDELFNFYNIENVTERRGFAAVPVNDGISFYAAQMCTEIQKEFAQKYTVCQREESSLDGIGEL